MWKEASLHCCCGTPSSKEAAQGGKRSEIVTKRLCIASDCHLINLGVKSLKNNCDLHSPAICMRLFNCCCSVEKDHGVHGWSSSPANQSQRAGGAYTWHFGVQVTTWGGEWCLSELSGLQKAGGHILGATGACSLA